MFGTELTKGGVLTQPTNLDSNERKAYKSDDFYTKIDDLLPDSLCVKLNLPTFNQIKLTDSQLYTGNIGIDFTNPIYKGSFNQIIYEKDSVLKIKNLIDSIAHLNPNVQIILVLRVGL